MWLIDVIWSYSAFRSQMVRSSFQRMYCALQRGVHAALSHVALLGGCRWRCRWRRGRWKGG